MLMAHLGPIWCEIKREWSIFLPPAAPPAGPPRQPGGGGVGARTASFRAFARQLRCARRLIRRYIGKISIYQPRRSTTKIVSSKATDRQSYYEYQPNDQTEFETLNQWLWP